MKERWEVHNDNVHQTKGWSWARSKWGRTQFQGYVNASADQASMDGRHWDTFALLAQKPKNATVVDRLPDWKVTRVCVTRSEGGKVWLRQETEMGYWVQLHNEH